jgi:hypothetical protein
LEGVLKQKFNRGDSLLPRGENARNPREYRVYP